MALEIVFFAGALVLLVVLIYASLSYRFRSRATHALAEEVTRARYQEAQDPARASPRLDRPSPLVAEPNGVEPAFSEEDIQRELFGPRGVKGAPDPAVMTPQREKKTPTFIDQGHVS
ncbi:MAG: hypothetical protein JO141_01605 [Bradyrhizobium sp.]|nr:hypothetical protein [Bradyrhizobium sp.]